MIESMVIAIGQAKSEPWESIWKNGQLPTWVNRFKNDYEIVNVSGLALSAMWKKFDTFHERQRYSARFGKWQGRLDYFFIPWLKRNIPSSKEVPASIIREILIKTNSSYIFAGRRLLGTIKWFLEENESQYLLLTTTSSLINVKNLKRRLRELDTKSPVYAGHLLGDGDSRFVTGAGQLINRQTAKIVVEHAREYPHRMLNDVALGQLLRNHNVKAIEIPWVWVKSVDEVSRLDLETLGSTFHFRVKTSTNPRTDDLVMRALHTRLLECNARGILEY
jgi:hypothetical protein